MCLFNFRFNICRESVKKTVQICQILIETVTFPEMEKRDKDFLELSETLGNGLWKFMPLLQLRPMMCLLYNLVQKDPDVSKPDYFQLNVSQQRMYRHFLAVIKVFEYNGCRIIINKIAVILLAFAKMFPVLGCYYYGFHRAFVNLPL